ncbi:MAG: DUF3800 domain-containing protein [Nitrospinota bacterium]
MSEKNIAYLFLDESGDHSLDKIDSQYPLFVLGGALITKTNYQIAKLQWSRMKKDLFGSEEIIIHTADLTRNRNGFEEMKKIKFREKVYEVLNVTMQNLDYLAIGCVILKDEHLNRYGLAALDPYHLSLNILVERAYFAMGRKGKLHIIAEGRDPTLDRMLEIAFLELKVSGTSFLSASEIGQLEMELHIRDKKKDIAGLQIADLLVSPMGRFVLGKKMYTDWDIIKSKLYRYRGKWEGAGLVVLPK